MKKQLSLLLVIGAAFVSSLTNASHFRGGAANASVDANGLVTISQTSFVRNTTATWGATTNFNLSGNGISSNATTTNNIDTSDSRFDVSTGTATFQLPGAGLYNYTSSSCCRVSGGHNFSASSYDVEGAIYWDGSTANAPVLFDFSSASNEVVVGSDYSQNLNAVGVGLTYDAALNVSINSQPPGFSIDPLTGEMTISAADTLTLQQNTSQDGADYAFSGNIIATDGSFTQFDWVLDVVTAASNLAPNLTDIVINGLVGDTFTGTMTGFDPENGALNNWWVASLLGAGMDITNFVFNALTQEFSFDTSGLSAGQYIANIGASDTELNGFGSITFNLSNAPTSSIPEPSSLILLALAGGLLLRTRKAN